MKKAVIWDLDGTLFDSYDVIVESISLALQDHSIYMEMDQIRQYAIRFSIKALFAYLSEEFNISAQLLQASYSKISAGKYLGIKRMPNALEILDQLTEAGVDNFVFTHRGKTTMPVLENLKMDRYFREVITSQSGFARKPDPEGIRYLMEKYGLDEQTTYYVGDRRLDMECAENAGISGILYLPPGAIDVSGGAEKHIVQDLLAIYPLIY